MDRASYPGLLTPAFVERWGEKAEYKAKMDR